MNQGTIGKIQEMLSSENKSEIDLGLHMVRTWVEENQPCNIPLVEGQRYIITYLTLTRRIERYAFRFKKEVHMQYQLQARHMLLFETDIQIEVNKIVKIVPV
mgnify:CR=1 FL=1